MLTKHVIFITLTLSLNLNLVKCFESDPGFSDDFLYNDLDGYTSAVIPDWDRDIEDHADSINNFIGEENENARDDFMREAIEAHYNEPEGPDFLYTRSPLHLMYLADMDREIYKSLIKYANTLKERLELVNRYVSDFEETMFHPLADAGIPDKETDLFSTYEWNWALKTSTHPILALQLLQRLTSTLPTIRQSVESGAENDLIEEIYQAKSTLYWPDANDVEETKKALLELHQTYDFDVGKFINGDVPDLNSTKIIQPVRPNVKADLCHELGVYAFKQNKYATALEWMKCAVEKINEEAQKYIHLGMETLPPSYEIIQTDYEFLVNEHDKQLKENSFEVFGEEKYGWQHDLFTQEAPSLPSLKGTKVKDLYLKKRNQIFDIPTPIINNQLCSGVTWQHPTVAPTLYCFYMTKNHPYLLLQPYRVEILNHRPQVIIIHNFVTNLAALDVIEFSMNTIFDDPNHREYLTPPPVLFDESMFPELNKMFYNFDILKTFHNQRDYLHTEERFYTQFYTYGFNEDEINHFPDFVIEETPEFSEQETFIVHAYLRDVDAGGYTIFPDLGISVKPTKGSALVFQKVHFQGFSNSPYLDLVWKNCPVISGLKWVGTKYFRQIGNNLKFDPFYNWNIE